jgi:hypothetical protein
VLKVYEGIGWPKLLPDLFPRYHVAGPLDERSKNLEGSILKLYLVAVASHLTASKVNFELSDPEARGCCGWYLHGGARPAVALTLALLLNEGQAGTELRGKATAPRLF